MTIEISHEGIVTIIRLNRPEARNAVNMATAAALREAWQAFDADEKARVAILTGGESVFCAGADLKDAEALLNDVDHPAGPMGFTRLMVKKPTIAAIAGYCVAGGLELACWCDLRIGDETTIMGCYERRFGVPLIDGGTVRLPQIIGLGRALELIMTGRPVEAAEAKHIGLLNEVVPTGQHLTRALELATLLAQFPQVALRNDRRSVYTALDQADALKIEAQIGAETAASEEVRGGIRAFLEGKGRGGKF